MSGGEWALKCSWWNTRREGADGRGAVGRRGYILVPRREGTTCCCSGSGVAGNTTDGGGRGAVREGAG